MLLRRVALTALWASVLAIDHPFNITFSDIDAAILSDPLKVRTRDDETVNISSVSDVYPSDGWSTVFDDRPDLDQPPLMTGVNKTNMWAYGVSRHRSSRVGSTMKVQAAYTAVYVWGKYNGSSPFTFTVDSSDYPVVMDGPRLVDSIPDAVQSDAVLIASATGLDMGDHMATLTVSDGYVEVMNVTITTLVSSDAKDISKTDTATQYTIKHPLPRSMERDDLDFSDDWTFTAPFDTSWFKGICTESGCRNDPYTIAGISFTNKASAEVQTPPNASLVQLWGTGDLLGVTSYEVRFSPPPPYGGSCRASQQSQWPVKWSRMCAMPLDPTKRYIMTISPLSDRGYFNLHGATYHLATCNNCSQEELAPSTATDAAASATSAGGPGASTGVAVAATGTRGSTNKGAIAGGVVGGVIGLALLALLFLCWRRRQRKKQDVVVASSPKDNYAHEEHEESAPPHLVPFQRVASGEQAVRQGGSGMAPFSPKATYTPHSAGDSSTNPSSALSPGSSSGPSQAHQSSSDWQEMDAGPIPAGPARLIPPSYNPAWHPAEPSNTV